MAVFFNQATLSYNGNTTTSNIVSGEIVEPLSATKTALSDTYTNDDRITYVVSLINSEETALTGVTVTDDLGAYTQNALTLTPLTYVDGSILYYVNGVLQATPEIEAGPPLVVNGLTIPAGGNALLVYEVATNAFTPLAVDNTVTNTATITADGLATSVTAQETITADAAADLSISKALSPTTVSDNGQITYTFLIQNNGNSDATAEDLLVVTDVFDPILSDLTVTFNGVSWTNTTNYTYDAATGLFQTIAGRITVPAATYTQDATTGTISITPGVSVLTVTGTV